MALRLSVVYLLCSFSQLVSFSPPLQIEVVNTFKSGASFQGALRRQSSVTSQSQDVANLSSPSRVSLSNALSSPTSLPPAAAGRECESLPPRAPPTSLAPGGKAGRGRGSKDMGGSRPWLGPGGWGPQLFRRSQPVTEYQSLGGSAGVRLGLQPVIRGREGHKWSKTRDQSKAHRQSGRFR